MLFVRLVLVCVTLLVAAGCPSSPPSKAKGTASVQAAPAAPPAPPSDPEGQASAVSRSAGLHQGAPVSDEEALAIGRQIEAAVAQADKQSFNALFDFAALGELIASDIPDGTADARKIREQLVTGSSAMIATMSDRLISQLNQGAYTLMRVRTDAGGKRALFRLRTTDGGLNYHDVRLVRRNGTVRAVDIYVFVSGEELSETMSRLMLSILTPEKRSLLSRLGGGKQRSFQQIDALTAMTKAMQAENFAETLRLYQTLPPTLQKSKPILLIRTLAAAKVHEREYLAAIDDYRAAFPGDPSLDLVAMDGHFVRKEWASVHAAIDRIDRAVGGDPYLQILRGGAFLQAGQHDEALGIGNQLLAADPQNQEALWLLVSVALARKDHAETARLLARARDEMKLEILDLTTVPEYAEFVQSPEYEEWKKSILK